jgi:hypothetical protein
MTHKERSNRDHPATCVECNGVLVPRVMTLCAGFGCSEHVCRKCWPGHIALHRLAGMAISEEYEETVRHSWQVGRLEELHHPRVTEVLSVILKQKPGKT